MARNEADFEQHLKEKDREEARKLTDRNVNHLTQKKSGDDLVKLFLAAKVIYKPFAYVLCFLFDLILDAYPKDKTLQETYYLGITDGEKRKPKKFFNSVKENNAYDYGVKKGEENIR